MFHNRVEHRHAIIVLLLLACHGCTGWHQAKHYFRVKQTRDLALAAERGDVEEIDRLISEGVDVNATGYKGITPLHWALHVGNKAGYRRLLRHKADPNLKLERGFKWIYRRGSTTVVLAPGDCVTGIAAAIDNDSSWLKLSLENGGNPSSVNMLHKHSRGYSPIFEATRYNNIENVKLLIAAGADLDHQNAYGETPLAMAADFYRFHLVYLLLEAGADHSIPDIHGHIATRRIANSTEDLIFGDDDEREWRLKVFEFLKNEGVDLAAYRDSGAIESLSGN